MNHFLFKLYNGDEIIGRLKSEDDVLNMHKDMQAGFTVLPSGGLNLALQSRYSDVII